MKILQVPHTLYPWPSKPKSTWNTWIGPPNTVHAVFGDLCFPTRQGLNNPGHFTFNSGTEKCTTNPSFVFQKASKGHGFGTSMPMPDTPLEPKCGQTGARLRMGRFGSGLETMPRDPTPVRSLSSYSTPTLHQRTPPSSLPFPTKSWRTWCWTCSGCPQLFMTKKPSTPLLSVWIGSRVGWL